MKKLLICGFILFLLILTLVPEVMALEKYSVDAGSNHKFVPSSLVANFVGTPRSGYAPLVVHFTDKSTGSPIGWVWYFGDERFSQEWTLMTDNAEWSPRYGHTSVAMPDGSIVLMGGYDNSIFKNDVWRSTDKGVTWTQMTANAEWSPRYGHTSIVMPDGSIILMGGTTTNYISGIKNDIWRSIDKGKTWTLVTDNAAWSPRFDYSSVVMPDGSIVLMGGLGGSGVWSSKNDVWRSTDKGVTWTQMTSNAEWSARYSQNSMAMPDGSVVLFGGVETVGTPPFKNDIWRSTDKGATWVIVNTSALSTGSCGGSSIVMPDGSVVLLVGNVDGSISSLKNEVWRSKDTGVTWTLVNAQSGWSPRSSESSVVMRDGSIVLMGGSDNSASFNRNDVWRLTPMGSSARNPTHTYTSVGKYNITLQVYNHTEYNITRMIGYVTVKQRSH